MTILINLGPQLIAEAAYQFLIANGYDDVVMSGRPHGNGFTPQVLLVDTTTLRQSLLIQYPVRRCSALMCRAWKSEKLCATLLSYRIRGVPSLHTELNLFKKARTAVSEGQLWIDNGSVKAVLKDTGVLSKPGRINTIADREQEIIEYVSEGLKDRQIAKACLTVGTRDEKGCR